MILCPYTNTNAQNVVSPLRKYCLFPKETLPNPVPNATEKVREKSVSLPEEKMGVTPALPAALHQAVLPPEVSGKTAVSSL
jgi:hypothetical protein